MFSFSFLPNEGVFFRNYIMVIQSLKPVGGTEYPLLVVVDKGGYGITTIIIIINFKEWTISPVPSRELQLLAPTLLKSSNCSSSLWSVVL